MNINTTSSSNAINPIISTGSLTNKVEAEAIKKIEDFHRQQALAIRREAGIRHNNPLTHEEQHKVGQLVMNAANGRASMKGVMFGSGTHAENAFHSALQDMVFFGEVKAAYGYHPALGNEPFISPLHECASNFKHAADLMSDQLRALFAQNNINMPNNLLTFSIDPFSFLVKVSGTDDENLISQLESLLNYGDNAKNLAQFIFYLIIEADMTAEQRQKFLLIQRVRNITGFDLRELSIADGVFKTQDGRNIADVFEEALKNTPQAEMAKAESAFILRELERLAPIWDSIPVNSLQIGWQNGLTSSKGHWLGKVDIRI
jgi:hypothetical protein